MSLRLRGDALLLFTRFAGALPEIHHLGGDPGLDGRQTPNAASTDGAFDGCKRVMKETKPDPDDYEGEWNPLWEFYFYAINGQRLVTIDCNNPNANYQPNCWVVGENVYFGKRLLVSNGVYVATDRLGTVRANTQGESFAYYPFGEERTSRPDGRDKFATYFRDGVGQDYARQRYYNSSIGRFWSPDPSGTKAANPANPTSWNLYTYVNGDPVNFNDPRGLDPNCGPDLDWTGEGCDPGSGNGDPGSTAENYSDTGDTGTTADQGDEDETGDTTPEPADPTPAQPCAADTCITVTGTLALVPYVTSTLTTELVPGFFDTVVDFFGGFVGFIAAGASNLIAVPAAILATPTATGCETRTPCQPQNTSSRWTCQAQCQVYDYSHGGDTRYGDTASGSGGTETQACEAAKINASQLSPIGTYSRHCKCFSCQPR